MHYELQEGNLVTAACPIPRHQRCIPRLGGRLEAQLPAHLDVFPDLDVDLQLVVPTGPGTVRRLDLMVVTREGFERREREGGVLRASEVVLAVEVVSLGSERTDRTIKRDECADAGIPATGWSTPANRVTACSSPPTASRASSATPTTAR